MCPHRETGHHRLVVTQAVRTVKTVPIFLGTAPCQRRIMTSPGKDPGPLHHQAPGAATDVASQVTLHVSAQTQKWVRMQPALHMRNRR